MAPSEYVGLVVVVEPDGDEVEVRALLRIEADGWWGRLPDRPGGLDRIWSSTEPFIELRLPDGRTGNCYASEFDQATRRRGHDRRRRHGTVRVISTR